MAFYVHHAWPPAHSIDLCFFFGLCMLMGDVPQICTTKPVVLQVLFFFPLPKRQLLLYLFLRRGLLFLFPPSTVFQQIIFRLFLTPTPLCDSCGACLRPSVGTRNAPSLISLSLFHLCAASMRLVRPFITMPSVKLLSLVLMPTAPNKAAAG